MLTDAAKRIAELASARAELPLGKPSFQPKERYKAFDFDDKNFKDIKQHSDMRVAFIDGGNLPIIQAPSFAVHFERVYVSCFKDSERVTLQIPHKLEFFVVVTSSGKENIQYQAHLIPLDDKFKEFLPNEKDLVFDSYDETMREGQTQMQISRVGDIARAFAEWRYAALVAKELDAGDLIVRDGTLHAPYTNLSAYAEGLYTVAQKKGVLLCGLSKTSNLYTTSGLPLVSAISRLARDIEAPWYYQDIVDITDPAHKADLNFSKLNKESKYIFRIEILQGQEAEKDKIMSALAENSKDISFPGYPYGLIDADKHARVSYDELDALKMLLFSEISKKGFDDFKDLLAASDAHDWLNNVV